jgi:methanogenic corrinoid protein MtbC1
MNPHGTFVARILDAGLATLAARAVVHQGERLRALGSSLPDGAFEDLVGDTEGRILALADALAFGRQELFTEQVEWSRSSYAARGLAQHNLELNLRCMREVLECELPKVGQAEALAMLDTALASFGRPARAIGSVLEQDAPHVELIRKLLLAVLEARREDALALVLNVNGGLGALDVETQVLAPLQAEIGRMWQRGEVNIHEEHMASDIVEEALVLLRHKVERQPANGHSVLVCSVVGNLHDIGSRIVADHFETDGWRTLRLGANLPSSDLVHAVRDFGADLVALSVTLTTQVRNAAAMIEALRRELGGGPPVLVGGPPFSQVRDLWQAVGADAWGASAAEAVGAGRRLLDER